MKYLICAVIIFSSAVWAGDVEDGDAALAKRDYATALKKYKLAAAKKNTYAQLQIGNIYNEGIGVKLDYAEAVRWYKLAAELGDTSAQSNLALMYNNGQGVLQDYVESVRWYKIVASQGDSNAQLNLGLKFSAGQGVAQDYVKAHMWYNLAAVGGEKKSIKYREIIASTMTQQQIAEAQKLARECQARNFKNCD